MQITGNAEVAVRHAVASDYEFVVALMDRTLDEFYDGDHRAHARRIFSAHIEGGIDHVGHFSFEQRMFISTVDDKPAGLLHIVGKRQGTYKISPLIVEERYRGRHGLGTALLTFAEGYARNQKARQLYCTVAEQNNGAMNFFERSGFLHAGMSESHYKAGMQEHMMYKLLDPDSTDGIAEEKTIAVVEFGEAHTRQLSDLILQSSLPHDFWGIDSAWITALLNGHRRRNSADVNTKYKLIYVAVNRSNEIVGVCGATPKKGKPIKLMPLVARTSDAFAALLHDIPWALRPFGHKVYTHLTPTVGETVTLQRLGWHLDAALPAAYHDDRVTQQWSKSLRGEADMRDLFIKARFFDLILSGAKKLEVRVAYPGLSRLQAGELLCLRSGPRSHVVRVQDVRRYPDFEKMLASEDKEEIVPGHPGSVLELLREIYPKKKEDLGVLAIELNPDCTEGLNPPQRSGTRIDAGTGTARPVSVRV